MRGVRDHLADLLGEIEAVTRFTALGRSQFLASERDQYAVMMAYARIGEIVKQLPTELLITQPHIEWREIKGFRDVLLHRYFDVNMERVWMAVEKLPELHAAVKALLSSLPPEDDA